MPETEVLSKKIIKIRKTLKQNQFEFAENCGISVETLSLSERKKADPRLSTIQKIAAYTGVLVSDLVDVGIIGYEMDCIYEIREDLIKDESGKNVKVYGIDVFRTVCMNKEILFSIPNIFVDYYRIQRLVNMCNENSVSVLHISDIIDDALLLE